MTFAFHRNGMLAIVVDIFGGLFGTDFRIRSTAVYVFQLFNRIGFGRGGDFRFLAAPAR